MYTTCIYSVHVHVYVHYTHVTYTCTYFVYEYLHVNYIHTCVYVYLMYTILGVFIRSLFWYPDVFLASGYSFNVCACVEIEHVTL